MLEIDPATPDPVAAKIEDGHVRLIDRDPAALAASLHPAQHEDPIAEITKLLRDALELLPVFAGVDGEPLDALASTVAAPVEGPDDARVVLEVGGRELGEQAIDVTAVVGIDHLPGDVHFVSGHACRSIAQSTSRREWR